MGKVPMPSNLSLSAANAQSAHSALNSDQPDLLKTGRFTPNQYIGRFAPSPTGELHFGSLVSALASYLDARYHQGIWLVRMEDIDPPREQPGAADAILRSLEAHGLLWDKSVLYQSSQSQIYENYLNKLREENLIYACDCSRQRLQTLHGIYDDYCRNRSLNLNLPHALRLKVDSLDDSDEIIEFTDLIQGKQTQNLRTQAGDQILKRKDGLYAYQLAVVVDDIEQGITHIIRGSDLLEVTARQLFLFDRLKRSRPAYGHVTIATHETGQKLSKQNLAPALKSQEASLNLWRALHFLGQNPSVELKFAPVNELLEQALVNWRLSSIQGLSAFAGDQN